jgi:hypothetical protein
LRSIVDGLPGNMPIGGVLSWPARSARKAGNAAKPARSRDQVRLDALLHRASHFARR